MGYLPLSRRTERPLLDRVNGNFRLFAVCGAVLRRYASGQKAAIVYLRWGSGCGTVIVDKDDHKFVGARRFE